MKNSKFIKNVVTGFGGQLAVIILGLIVPRVMIKSYGSDVNGLISTITQIFTYMALLEAGIGQAAKNALYKPISEKNTDKINHILVTAKVYFGRFTIYYAVGVIALAILSPLIIKTNVSAIIVFFIIVFEGLSGVVSFYYIQTPTIMLNADGRSYINNVINLSNKTLGYVVKIFMATKGFSIVLLQFSYFIITIAKVIFYQLYLKKHYKWISLKGKPDFHLLKDRNSYVLTEIAWTVFSSTDMIVLSVFVSTQLSSVYSIYNMIYTNINVLLNSVAVSVSYILGKTYHENIKKYEIIHDSLTSLYLGVMTILMSVCYILIIPFINLYTKDVADINYIYPSLPLLFSLVQLLSWSRNVSGNLTGIAGYAKSTSYISLIEALLNLAFSIILVQAYGIIGVLLATVIALPLKVIWCMYISDKKVLSRSLSKSIKILGVNYMLFFAVVLISSIVNVTINSYLEFVLFGGIYTAIIGTIGLFLNIVVNKDLILTVKKYILKR